MASAAAAGMVPSAGPVMDCDLFGRQFATVTSCCVVRSRGGRVLQVLRFRRDLPLFHQITRLQQARHWKIAFALNTGGAPAPDTGGQEGLNGDSPGAGRTRLGVIVRAASKQILDKLNATRKNFPIKIFLLLLGFYTANALATILGQTGDWDVLVAGVVVAAIEGIGMLMYRKPMSPPSGRIQSLVVMVNYWKAGVCLGLFVDAFKLGS